MMEVDSIRPTPWPALTSTSRWRPSGGTVTSSDVTNVTMTSFGFIRWAWVMDGGGHSLLLASEQPQAASTTKAA